MGRNGFSLVFKLVHIMDEYAVHIIEERTALRFVSILEYTYREISTSSSSFKAEKSAADGRMALGSGVV